MIKVFVSHSSKDRSLVQAELVRPLEILGFKPWFALDDIDTLEEWERAIARALDSCDWFIVALTPKAVDSKWVRTETRRALDRDSGRVVPVLLAPCDMSRISLRLPDIQGVDFTQDSAKGRARFSKFWRGVARDGGRTSETKEDASKEHGTFLTGLYETHMAEGTSQRSGAADLGEEESEHQLATAAAVGDPPSIAFMLSCLGDKSPRISESAEAHLERLGVANLKRALVTVGKNDDEVAIRRALDGLLLVRPSQNLISILTVFSDSLAGNHAKRAFSIIERKVAGLEARRVKTELIESGGNFTIKAVLGQGPLTLSFLAEDAASGFPLVVRILKKEFAEKPRIRGSFLDAMQRSQALVHPNLVVTRWSRRDDSLGQYYTVRDYIDGVTLRDAIEDGRSWSVEQSVDVVRQILVALLQSQLYDSVEHHGGLHPGNVFVDASNKITIGDPAPRLSLDDVAFAGRSYSYNYIAPEMVTSSVETQTGAGPGRRSDLYSLGCMAYELLTGRALRTATGVFDLVESIRQLDMDHAWKRSPDVPAALREFVTPLVSPDPADRPDTIRGTLIGLNAAMESLYSTDSAVASVGELSQLVSATLIHRQSADRSQASILLGRASGLIQDVPSAAGDRTTGAVAEDEAKTPGRTIDVTPSYGGDSGSDTSAGRREEGTEEGDASSPHGETIPPASAGVSRGRPEELLRQTHTLAGLTLADRYRVLTVLGVGGMATAYLARDMRFDRQVVVKAPHARLAYEPGFRQRFHMEIQNLVTLDHPGIVKIYDVGEFEEVVYFVMQYLSGGNLGDRMKAATPENRVLEWLFPMASALDFVHGQGILHRDVKPSNILFDDGDNPFLSDFGIAKLQDQADTNLTATGMLIGSPDYMAPEQGFGDVVGPASDQYALATTVYQCLSGRLPFKRESPLALVLSKQRDDPTPLLAVAKHVPRKASEVLQKALSRDPAARYGNCVEFTEAMQAALRVEQRRWFRKR